MGIYKRFKVYLAGFFSCLSLLILIGLSQQKSRYDNPNDIYSEFEYLYRKTQDRQLKIVSSTPTLANMDEGELLFYNSTGTLVLNLITRVKERRYKVELSSF